MTGKWNGIKFRCSFKGCRRKIGADSIEHSTKEADGWSALTSSTGSTYWICPLHSLRVRGLVLDGADSEHYVDRPKKAPTFDEYMAFCSTRYPPATRQRKPSSRGRYFPRWSPAAYDRAFPATADQQRFLESIRRGRR